MDAARNWRVVDVTGTTCAESMARVPVICDSVAAGRSDEVFLVGCFGTRHFNVGWFDDIDEVIDLDAARAEGVEVVRRMVYGGGTAYYDGDAALVVSEIVRGDRFESLDSALDAWQPIVLDVMGQLGLEDVKFEGSSDLRWHGRKLGSFMANAVMGCVSIGGYMNLRVPDMGVYARCSRVPEEKFRDKLVKDHLAYIVTPEEIRGTPVRPDEAKAAWLDALERHTHMRPVELPTTADEDEGIGGFVAWMSSDEQLHRISSRRFVDEAPDGTRVGLAWFKANKLIRTGVAVDNAGRLAAVFLAGDMMLSPPDVIDRTADALVGIDVRDTPAMQAAVASVLEGDDVSQADVHMGITAGDVVHALGLAIEDARSAEIRGHGA